MRPASITATDAGRADHTESGRRHVWHVPDIVWGPLSVTFLLAVPGALGYFLGQPWLFPSLGSTAFLQAESPHLPSARFYNAVAGHLLGVGAAFLAVTALGAANEPSVLSSHILSAPRLAASLLAVMLTLLATTLLRASHPPAAATTLLIALGGMQATGKEAATICAGVFIVAATGAVFRQLRLRVFVA
jgi:CBS-domain-containing membrane protein